LASIGETGGITGRSMVTACHLRALSKRVV
jgi:hypothetical protein